MAEEEKSALTGGLRYQRMKAVGSKWAGRNYSLREPKRATCLNVERERELSSNEAEAAVSSRTMYSLPARPLAKQSGESGCPTLYVCTRLNIQCCYKINIANIDDIHCKFLEVKTFSTTSKPILQKNLYSLYVICMFPLLDEIFSIAYEKI